MKNFLPIFLFFLLQHTFTFAHESRPLYIKITETTQQLTFEVNLPNTVNERNTPLIYLNDTPINAQQAWRVKNTGFRQKWQGTKKELTLRGSIIKIVYPVFNPVLSTIIAITYSNTSEQMLVIPPDQQEILIPKETNAMEVRKQYNILGIEHIWAGIDHLLFLVCLILITGFSRKLLITITGFTLAHSVTLILSALKVIQLPIPPIEATIALSIVFLCYEIIHHHTTKDSLTYQYPILVASSFGLLHGLGFAAVLGEIGLPKNHTIEALLFFNIGVEIGQVIFILALFLAAFFVNKIFQSLLSKTTRQLLLSLGLKVAIYFVGILAAYWMFDRMG